MIIVLHVKLNSPQSAILVSIIARMGVWVLDNHCAIIPPAFALESGLCLKKSGKCRRSKNRESKPWPGQPGSKVYANRSHSCISRLDSCNPPTLVPEVPSFLFVNHILAAFAPVENRKNSGARVPFTFYLISVFISSPWREDQFPDFIYYKTYHLHCKNAASQEWSGARVIDIVSW